MPLSHIPTIKEFAEHILLVIGLYEASTDKIERIHIYTKSVLDSINKEKKKEVKTNAKRKRRKG